MNARTDLPLTLKQVMSELGLSVRRLAQGAGLSIGAASRLVNAGVWPVRQPRHALEQSVCAWLLGHGLQHGHLMAMRQAGVVSLDWGVYRSLVLAAVERGEIDANEVEASLAALNSEAPPSREPGEAPVDAVTPNVPDEPPENDMLLECTPLTEQARKAWNLPRSPFIDDIASRDDVFASPATRRVRAALLDCAMHHGFIAVIGESGSGKTTLREDLEQRILDEQRPIIVVKPYTLAMEPNDTTGKRMKSGQIAEAIAHALAPSVQLKSSPQARFQQVHDQLRDSARAGNRHLLVIEEAHRMPLATLKHLKGWMELKDGLRRLIGVCLIGQPELGTRLSETQPEIREIVQRCEKVVMEPLDEALAPYLKLKFDRVGVDITEVLAEDAYDALRVKLMAMPRHGKAEDAYSICYPLAVNNHVARAMNAAAAAGWPKVDAQVVAGS